FADVNAIVRGKGVAGIDEHDAFHAQRFNDRENDLVIRNELLTAADRTAAEELAAGEGIVLARPEGQDAVAAHRVDAAGEVALEQRQIAELTIAEPVAEVEAGGRHERAPRRALIEWIVPARAGFGFDELALAADAGELEREVLQRAGGRIEGVVAGVPKDARR